MHESSQKFARLEIHKCLNGSFLNSYSVKKRKIYILDIDPDQRVMISAAAGTVFSDCQVVKFTDGSIMLQRLFYDRKVKRPIAIFMDLVFHRVHGREVLRQIKADPILNYVPVVVFTRNTSSDNIDLLTKSGVCRCVLKTSSLDEYLGIVASIKTELKL